jgi:type VI secretion system protein VasI
VHVVCLILLLPCSHLGAAERQVTTPCPGITDRSDRLDCFDRIDRESHVTPSLPAHVPADPLSVHDVISVVAMQEARRTPGQKGFLLADDAADARHIPWKVVGSTPSIPPSLPGSFLVMSCASNISRIQIVSRQRMVQSLATVRLVTGTAGQGAASEWRILEGGRLADGGRGLPAIERIRTLGTGGELYVASTNPELDGLLFDMSGAQQVIDHLRKACHW